MKLHLPSVLGLSVSLIGCSRGSVTLGDITSADDVSEVCDEYEGEIVIETVEVTFPENTEPCPWGEDDNGWEKTSRIMARIEQYETLEVDTSKLLCDMEMDLAGVERDEVQLIYYDDFFFFTFDDVVLASNHGPAVMDLPIEDNMPIYDWDSLYSRQFDDGDQGFCLGEDAGWSECDIPVSQETGPISLDYGPQIIDRLSARAVNQERFEFGFITTGDNDEEKDCQHTEFTFTVEVETLELAAE